MCDQRKTVVHGSLKAHPIFKPVESKSSAAAVEAAADHAVIRQAAVDQLRIDQVAAASASASAARAENDQV